MYDWEILVTGPRSSYPLDWNIIDFDELRLGEHIRDLNFSLEWTYMVQFFGENIETVTLSLNNREYSIGEMFEWPLIDSSIVVSPIPMESGYGKVNV